MNQSIVQLLTREGNILESFIQLRINFGLVEVCSLDKETTDNQPKPISEGRPDWRHAENDVEVPLNVLQEDGIQVCE